MQFLIVAELRETYPSLITSEKIYNDYVSKNSMYKLVNGISSLGYDCKYLGGTKELYHFYKNKEYHDDIIFINYNYGLPAQYKRVQAPALFELMHAKYSGSDPFSSLLVNDKAYCKKILSNAHILSPNGYLICNKSDANNCFASINLNIPLVVKPNLEGSSLGINDESFCLSYDSAKHKAYQLLEQFPQVLVEEFVEGYECTVWLMGNGQDFPFIKPLIVSTNQKYYFEDKIFTLDDKANHKKNYDLPSNILPSIVVQKLVDLSKEIFNALGLRDYARIDYRINNNNIYFIEANALPVFSISSEIGAISELYSLSYKDICHVLTDVILKRLMS